MKIELMLDDNTGIRRQVSQDVETGYNIFYIQKSEDFNSLREGTDWPETGGDTLDILYEKNIFPFILVKKNPEHNATDKILLEIAKSNDYKYEAWDSFGSAYNPKKEVSFSSAALGAQAFVSHQRDQFSYALSHGLLTIPEFLEAWPGIKKKYGINEDDE